MTEARDRHPGRGRLRRLFHRIAPILGVLLFAAALWILYHELRHYRLADIAREIASMAPARVVAALLLTVLSFFALTLYDTLAVRYVGHRLPYRKVALASFVGFAFSQSLGFPLLTGAPARYRMYSGWGLSTVDISQVIGFYTLTFWIGVAILAGFVFLLEPAGLPVHLPMAAGVLRLLGIVLLVLVAAYYAWALRGGRPLRIADWQFPPPSRRLATLQMVASPLDWALAASVLYVLLPSRAGLGYPAFLGIFLVAQVTGLVSHVPGGLGVFEATLLLLLPEGMPQGALVSSLLAYRGIYYLLPLVVAAITFGAREIRGRREDVRQVGRSLQRWSSVLAPRVLAVAVFLGGAVLLFSGATPAVPLRLRWLSRVLPLGVIELSHFLASVAGAGLLVLAWGLRRRLDAAWGLTVLCLLAGIVFALLRGLDYEESAVLAGMLLLMLPARKQFYRKTSLLAEPFTPSWVLAVSIVILASVWLGLFAYRHVGYSQSLWWSFALRGDAPRFLRASIGASAVLLVVGAVRLLRAAPPEPGLPTEDDLARAERVISRAPEAQANLAYAGDKALLFSESERSFLMYGVEGRSWVALGDPVGPEEEWEELAWSFREMTDRHDDWAVFYEVSPRRLDLFLELGLTLLKLGEKARVALQSFSLEGGGRSGLRRTVRRLEREGCRFELLRPPGTMPLLPELRRISDAWLAEKSSSEKGFSMGFFDERYLSRFPLGLVRREDRIVAFSNLWTGGDLHELSPDLMRYAPGAPSGVMEYLFVQLILRAREDGYEWFDLGMAPLSGLDDRPLAPMWNRLGALIYRFGEHFYSFQGLREYKEKFDPVWEPRYLASPGGFALPRILTNVSSLISGGLRGIFT